jgi:hypothetical protein
MVIEFISSMVRDGSAADSGLGWQLIRVVIPRDNLRGQAGWSAACQEDSGVLELGRRCGRHDPKIKLFPYWTIHRTAS